MSEQWDHLGKSIRHQYIRWWHSQQEPYTDEEILRLTEPKYAEMCQRIAQKRRAGEAYSVGEEGFAALLGVILLAFGRLEAIDTILDCMPSQEQSEGMSTLMYDVQVLLRMLDVPYDFSPLRTATHEGPALVRKWVDFYRDALRWDEDMGYYVLDGWTWDEDTGRYVAQ
ncbi:MAG: hypothetical protein GYB68_06005 [Chloroflexi bacterium]|nr:hypothetical protein [Chloroflexota bacterium]